MSIAFIGMAELVWAAPALTEIEGTLQVCTTGPDAAIARARRLQGMAEVAVAKVLPNPSLILQHQRTFTGPAERESIVGFSIPVGVSGRRGLLQDVALASREQAFADAAATLFESALAFREAYVTALVDQARADILNEQQTALEGTAKAIEALAKSGEAAAYDLLRQRVQARIHRGAVESARALAQASRTRLEAWTGAEVVLPVEALSTLTGAGAHRPPTDDLPQTHRVQSLQAGARSSALEVRAARRRWLPDPEVFAGYRVLDGDTDIAHGLSVSLTLPLTFFDHGQGEAARAEAETELMTAAADQLRRQQRAEAKAARARLEQLSSSVAGLGQARSDAGALVTQAEQLYVAGEASITEMLEAFRAAEEAQLAELDRVFEIARARLLVMRATGTLFDARLDRACLHQEPRPR